MIAPDAPSPLVVVAGHICLDIIPVLAEEPDLRPGSLVEIGPAALSAGGPVGNVGLALHRLGVPVRLVGKIGADVFGRVLLDVIRRRDPALADGMLVASGETTSYSVVISPPGLDRTFLHCAGANHTFGAADVPVDALCGARILHFGYPPVMRRFYADGGVEYIGRPQGWGVERRREFLRNRYHKPLDEVDSSWDLSGAVEDMEALFKVGLGLATTDARPQWREKSEFRRAREELLKKRR